MENKTSNKIVNYGILTSLVFILVILSYRYVVNQNRCESNEGYKYEWWKCVDKNPAITTPERRINLENKLRNMDTDTSNSDDVQQNKNYNQKYLTMKYATNDGEVELITITSQSEALPIVYENYLLFLSPEKNLMAFDLRKNESPILMSNLASENLFEQNTLFCLPKQNTLSGNPRFLVFNSAGEQQTETSYPQGCTPTLPELQNNELINFIAEKNTSMRTLKYLELLELPDMIILEMGE